MTINTILDDMDNKRKEIKKNKDPFLKISKSLDNNKTLDFSNNQIVKYNSNSNKKKKTTIDDFLTNINFYKINWNKNLLYSSIILWKLLI